MRKQEIVCLEFALLFISLFKNSSFGLSLCFFSQKVVFVKAIISLFSIEFKNFQEAFVVEVSALFFTKKANIPLFDSSFIDASSPK